MVRSPARFASLALLAGVLLGAPAVGARSPGPVQGVWQGAGDGAGRGVATLRVAGDGFVLMDDAEIVVGTASWRHHGPGTKDGRLTLQLDLSVTGRFAADGRPSRSRRGKWLGSAVVGDEQARICLVESANERHRPGYSSAVGRPGPAPLRCYDLTQVAPAGQARTRPAPPRVGPPDGSAPNPPPRIEPQAHECMTECRQQNMMRAVSADQIDADCRRTCGLAPATPSP